MQLAAALAAALPAPALAATAITAPAVAAATVRVDMRRSQRVLRWHADRRIRPL